MITIHEVDLYYVVPGLPSRANLFIKLQLDVPEENRTMWVLPQYPLDTPPQIARIDPPSTYPVDGFDMPIGTLFQLLTHNDHTPIRVSCRDPAGSWFWITTVAQTNKQPLVEVRDTDNNLVIHVAPHAHLLVYPLASDETLNAGPPATEIIEKSYPIQLRHLAQTTPLVRLSTPEEEELNPTIHKLAVSRFASRTVIGEEVAYYLTSEQLYLFPTSRAIVQTLVR